MLVSVSQAWGYSCQESDKLEDLRSHLAPLRDQDSVGWCYAFTAADLVTDYLRRNRNQIPKNISNTIDFTKTENTISPLSGAFAMENGESDSLVQFRAHADESLKNYDEVLEINQKIAKTNKQISELCGQKGCLWGCITNDNLKSDASCVEWNKAHDLKKIEQLDAEREMLVTRKKLYSGAYSKGVIEGGRTENIAEYYLSNGFSFEKQISSEDISNSDMLSELNERMLYAYMEAKTKDEAICNGFNVIKKICSSCEDSFSEIKPVLEAGFDWKRSPFHDFMNLDIMKHKIKNPTLPNVKNISAIKPDDRRETINQYLGKGQIVGIGYDVKDVVSLNSGGHASSIVGRTCIEGQEHFILRNSWGDQACEESKKSMTLKKLEGLSKRIKYGASTVTQEDKDKYDLASSYHSCLDQCQNIKEPREEYDNFMELGKPTNIEEINRKKLEKTECESACYQTSKPSLSKVVETFECDKGYFLIRSEKLLNSIDDIQVIE